jgi:hypothetical protein
MMMMMMMNLHIFSSSNKPTFVFNNMKELIDLEVRNLMNDFHLSDEPSLSDFRFTCFQKGSFELIEVTVRYPNKMNWELQR